MFLILFWVTNLGFAQEFTPRQLQEIEYKAGTAYNRGVELYKKNQYLSAIDSFEASLDLYKKVDTEENPKTEIIRGLNKNLAILYYITEQYDKALEFYVKRKKCEQNNYRVYLTMSKILEKQGRQDSACCVLQEFDEIRDNYKIKRKIAEIYESKGNLDNAIKYYSEAFQLNDSKVDILEKIALLYHKNGNTQEAIKVYNDFIATNPPDYILRKVYKNIGIFYQRTDETKKAIEAFKKSVEIKPDKKLYFNIAQLYYDNKNYAAAENYLKQLQEIDPNYPGANIYLDSVYTKQGKKTDEASGLKQYNKIEDNQIEKVNKTDTSTQMSGSTGPLSIEIIKEESLGNEMVEVQIKVTNISDKDIHNAIMTCVAENSSGRPLDYKKHYVIKSSEGGLNSGNSTYFTYILDANPGLVANAVFQIDNIKYK